MQRPEHNLPVAPYRSLLAVLALAMSVALSRCGIDTTKATQSGAIATPTATVHIAPPEGLPPEPTHAVSARIDLFQVTTEGWRCGSQSDSFNSPALILAHPERTSYSVGEVQAVSRYLQGQTLAADEI